MKKFSIVFLGLGILLFSGCSKDALYDSNNKSLSSHEVKAQIKANAVTEGLDEILAELLINKKTGSAKKANTDCMEVRFSEQGIVVVYKKCSINGNYMDGTLVLRANLSDTEDAKGSFDITFDAFTYNQHKLKGTKKMIMDYSQIKKPVLTVITDVKVIAYSKAIIGHTGSKVFAYNLNHINTGKTYVSSTGQWDIEHEGTRYQFKVTDPLTGKLNCAYITSGVVELEVNGSTALLDFGKGDCDKMATVLYLDGKSEEISW